MKLEAHFQSRNNSLFFIDGAECPVVGCPVLDVRTCMQNAAFAAQKESVCCVQIPWTAVGCDGSSYNEAFLAELRDWLKSLEGTSHFVFMQPLADCAAVSSSQKEALAESFTHCARRIKDCSAVIGFAIPDLFDGSESAAFMAALRKKHAHYCFFSRIPAHLVDSSVVQF
ncbi:MAG: hypothetical protein J1D88_05100 [Treponema sp.]|nr:hypothetical protein [Treponema sp.]